MDWSMVGAELIAHLGWSLAVLSAVGLMGWLAFKYVLPPTLKNALDTWGAVAIPAGVKESLTNGSGEIVRTIIRAENEHQTMANVEHIQAVVDRHQEIEQRADDERHRALSDRIDNVVLQLEGRLDRHEDRIRALEIAKKRKGA